MDAVMSMIQTQVIQAWIKWILGLLSPVGAFVKAALAIVDVVKFFMQRAAQIGELVDAFVNSVAAIASGNVGAVAKAIEGALGKAVPVLIGLLASILGIGGITDKVLGLIRKIRKRITVAITNFWVKVKKGAGKLLRKLGNTKAGKKTKDLYKKGKEKVLDTKDRIFNFFMGTISFTAADDSRHRIYPKSKNESKTIMLASTPKPIEIQLESEKIISEQRGETDNARKINEAKTYYAENIKPVVSKLGIEAEELEEQSANRDVKGEDKNAIEKVEELSSKRDSRFLKLVALLKQATFSHGEKTKIKTNVTWKNTGDSGDFVEARPLTYLKGNTKGAKPGSANPPGWSFAQHLNEQFGGIAFIRGHMLNDNIHGPNKDWNLKPISQRMNREMDQWIENNAVREHKEKHKILFYKATVDEYHSGAKHAEGAFPKSLTVEWGHLMKEGVFDEKGIKITVQAKVFTQSFPERKSININEFGDTLLIRNLTELGLTEKFIKEVVIFLKKKTDKNRFEDIDDFFKLYEIKIEGTKRENETMLMLIDNLENNNIVNFK